MITIGEINDKRMAEEIIDELKAHNILAQYLFRPELNSNVLAIENQDDFEVAHDLYRVKLGLRKPTKIDPEWLKIKSIPRGQITYGILLFCVGIYLLSFLPLGKLLYDFFMLDEQKVLQGEVWRIFTPILLHMSFLHILFNMLWFKDLGYAIEYSFGKHFLIKFILITALISNLLQFFSHGPSFGGMSGVLYGMLGFIWVYKNLNPQFEYSLPKSDIYLMIFWFFLCLSGILEMIANMAHAGGIVTGILVAVFMDFKMEKARIKYFLWAMFFLLITVLVEAYKLNGKFYITKWVKL
jgi:GlpG protein